MTNQRRQFERAGDTQPPIRALAIGKDRRFRDPEIESGRFDRHAWLYPWIIGRKRYLHAVIHDAARHRAHRVDGCDFAGDGKPVDGVERERRLLADGDSLLALRVNGAELQQFVERIERLEEEKKAIADDIKEVYSEIKSRGYDVKIMRQIVRLRKMSAAERQEMQAILDLYTDALGMAGVVADTVARFGAVDVLCAPRRLLTSAPGPCSRLATPSRRSSGGAVPWRRSP